MSGRKILRRFSSSISDLLSIQKKSESLGENEEGTALHRAVLMGNTVMAKSLLENKVVWIDEEDSKGRTALHHACENGSAELSSLLLSSGANGDCVDFEGLSAAHLAARRGMCDTFDVLVAHQADVHAVDKLGRTAFDLAAEAGNEKMVLHMLSTVDVRLLRKAGAAHKASALHLAARNGHVQIVHSLIEAGWDLHRCTHAGTALHEAAGWGRAQVVRFLLHVGIDSSLTNGTSHTAFEFAKKNSHRNPITFKEIRFLLKESASFAYAEAVEDHFGLRADELSFNKADLIWVISRAQSGSGARWQGIVFGQRGNSRSGYFHSPAVQIVEKERKVSMSTRLDVHGERQAPKRISLPVVPIVQPINKHRDQQRRSNGSSSYRSVASPSAMSDRSSDSNGMRTFRSSQFGSSSTFQSYGTNTAHLLSGKNDMSSPRVPPLSGLGSSPLAGSPMVASSLGEPCDRNSNGSSSSHTSGFESIEGTTSASTSSSSFLGSSQLTPSTHDSPSSRISFHSNSSCASGPSFAPPEDECGNGPAAPATQTHNVPAMVAKGIPDAEVLAIWLSSLGMSEVLSPLLTQGYDLATISRVTPEDLQSLGINPQFRKRLMQEIHSWQLADNWPSHPPPGGLSDWLSQLSLSEYVSLFESQGCRTVEDVMQLTWEDFEDIGIKKLGHLKRLGLAVRKMKESRRRGVPVQHAASPVVHAAPQYSPRFDMHEPPPPAPVSVKRPSQLCMRYPGKAASSRSSPDYSNLPVLAGSTVRPPTNNLFSQHDPIRLNLISTGAILSDAKKMEQLGGGEANCPPPPAPLFCDASIRRLQSAYSSEKEEKTYEPLPFNTGTIRARAPRPLSAESQAWKRSSDKSEKSSVLNDIDDMLENLTDELDAMMMQPMKGEERRSATSKYV